MKIEYEYYKVKALYILSRKLRKYNIDFDFEMIIIINNQHIFLWNVNDE